MSAGAFLFPHFMVFSALTLLVLLFPFSFPYVVLRDNHAQVAQLPLAVLLSANL